MSEFVSHSGPDSFIHLLNHFSLAAFVSLSPIQSLQNKMQIYFRETEHFLGLRGQIVCLT